MQIIIWDTRNRIWRNDSNVSNIVMLSEAELPLAEAQGVEAPLPRQELHAARVRQGSFGLASEEEQALRMTNLESKCIQTKLRNL